MNILIIQEKRIMLMIGINDLQFYELRKIRTKKFAKRLRKVFSDNKIEDETFEQKQERIKAIADKINSKL